MKKTLLLKHTASGGGNLTPQRSGVAPGYQNGCATIEVTGLPDGATHRDAIRVVQSLMLPGWLYSVDASQAGKNLYLEENLTEAQKAGAPDWLVAKWAAREEATP